MARQLLNDCKLSRLVNEYYTANEKAKEVTKEADRLKAEIKSYMNDKGVDIYTSGAGITATLKEEQRETADTEIVKQFSEVWEKAKKVTVSQKLRVKKGA